MQLQGSLNYLPCLLHVVSLSTDPPYVATTSAFSEALTVFEVVIGL